MKRAFLIYECEHGWCIEESVPPLHSSRVQSSAVWAFSRLSQALWWLGRYASARRRDAA